MSITRDMWYRNPEVIYNIYWCQKDRELAFLERAIEHKHPIRNLFPFYTALMKHYMGLYTTKFKDKDPFRFVERKYNVYYSLAKFHNIHAFSFSPKIRKEQSREWNKVAVKHIYEMDIGLDFDAPDLEHWKDAYDDVKAVKRDLDAYDVPYALKWSGGKGFHLRIPNVALPAFMGFSRDLKENKEYTPFIRGFADILTSVYGRKLKNTTGSGEYVLKTLDMGVFDLRRVWKCEYSWTCETGLIALPLTDEQFEMFKPEMCKPEMVLKNGIRNRFDLMRPGKPEGFKNWCTEVLGIEW